MTIITPTGAETLVNTTTANDQSQIQTSALANGQYVVVWTDNLLPGAINSANALNADIKARIFNADGTPAGAEFMVNGLASGRQAYASVTTLSDGNFLVAWMEELGPILGGAGSPNAQIKAREFTAAGVPVGSEFLIGSSADSNLLPSVTATAGGGFAVSYHVGGIGGSAVMQQYDANNATVGSPVTLSTAAGTIGYAALRTLADGNIVAVMNSATGSGPAFTARVLTPAGVQVGNDMTFGFAPNGARLDGIAALTSGGFAVSYWAVNGTQTNLMVTGYLAEQLTTNVQIASVSTSTVNPNFLSVNIAPLANGGVAVAWSDYLGTDGSGSHVMLSAYNGIGNEIGTAQQINTNTSGNQLSARVVALSNGDVVALWNDPSGTLGDASGLSIKQQVFDVNPVNQNPVAANDVLSDTGTGFILDAEFTLLTNDNDADGDPLVVTAISNVQGGTASLNVLTQEISVSRASPTSTVTFSYTISDGAGGTANANATILTSRDDLVTVRGAFAVLDVLANDGLVARPEGYTLFPSTPPSANQVSYRTFGTNQSTVYLASVVWNAGHGGYAFLPVGQTLTDTFFYSVVNPATGLADYNAQASITLQGWTQTGTAVRDTLVGGAQADHLVGGTGAANELIGGAGDDWYTIEAVGDTIVELAGGGNDTVYTTLGSFVMPNEVERLVYVGSPGTPFVGIGNASANILNGGTGRDVLMGGVGNDTLQGGGGGTGNENFLFGGTGDDIYIVSILGDSTIELAGEGTDTVQTALGTYALQANVENLTFTNSAAHTAGVGNALDNVITGNTGYDELYGLAGNDTLRGGATTANALIGGAGDDTYVVTAVGDSVIELAGEGTDSVQTSTASFTLYANVENLTYTGTLLFTGIGNAEANAITGGVAMDFLSGLDGADILTGGSGADTLLGGNGADQFRYAGGETGVDRILDFTAGSDKIALSNTGFTHTTTIGFIQGTAATEAVSTFLYDTSTGMVSFDADGNGAGAAVQIAQLNAGLSLSVTDFVFYG